MYCCREDRTQDADVAEILQVVASESSGVTVGEGKRIDKDVADELRELKMSLVGSSTAPQS